MQSDAFVPTVASINSAAEQEYLNQFIFGTSGVKIDVWLGAKRTGNQFAWDDGSAFDYTNWAEGHPSEEIGRDCVEMQSSFMRKFPNESYSNLLGIGGKWKDVTCEAPNYVLCQKLQTWSLQDLQKTFLDFMKKQQDSFKNVTDQLSDTRNQLDNTKNELEVLQQNPSKPSNAYYMHLLIHSFYSPNWLHLCSATGSTGTAALMGISDLGRNHCTVRWTFLSCRRKQFSSFWDNTRRKCT